MRSVLWAGVLLILAVTQAQAQTCMGAPSFREKPMQGGFTASFIGERHEIGGTFAAGKTSLFGTVGVLATHISYLGTAPALTVGVGTEISSSDHPVFTCPLLQVEFNAGPDFGPFETSSVGVRGGISVGAIVAETRGGTQLVPTFALACSTTERRCRLPTSKTQTRFGRAWPRSVAESWSTRTSRSSPHWKSRSRRATPLPVFRFGGSTASGAESSSHFPVLLFSVRVLSSLRSSAF
jgi:hypothetical protein